MKQDFVYHSLNRPQPRRRARTAVAAQNATEAVKEYLAYVGLLSVAVAIAIMTFAYTAHLTISWLDVISKPGFFSTETHTLASPAASATAPTKFAMLPASTSNSK